MNTIAPEEASRLTTEPYTSDMAGTSEFDFDTLDEAFNRREFFLVYQPILSLQDGRCLGAEALIRWKRSDGTTLDAGSFMPSAHGTPLSGRITYWVMDTVAIELGDWLGWNPEASIAINVPPEILGRGGLEYAASKSGLKARASQLILEVTEHGVPDQLGLDALNKVPSTGARVALDDTTLSGSNLALLMRCHFDFLKLDRTLLRQIDGVRSSVRPEWLDGLSTLLETTSLQVIAEGIESAAQHDILAGAGVPWGQGHYLAEPQGALAFMRFYAAKTGAAR
jgi:sensor c-di-GMP phosphodiesterase-like protein